MFCSYGVSGSRHKWEFWIYYQEMTRNGFVSGLANSGTLPGAILGEGAEAALHSIYCTLKRWSLALARMEKFRSCQSILFP